MEGVADAAHQRRAPAFRRRSERRRVQASALAWDERQQLGEPGWVRLLPSAMRLSALAAVELPRVVRSDYGAAAANHCCSCLSAELSTAFLFLRA